MKKFLVALALLSMTAFTFVGCSHVADEDETTPAEGEEVVEPEEPAAEEEVAEEPAEEEEAAE